MGLSFWLHLQTSACVTSSRKPTPILPGNLPGQMAIPFSIVQDQSARILGGQGPPSTLWRDTQHSTWGGVGGQQLTQFSLSCPLCSSVSGSQASSHYSVGIKWAAEAEGYEKSQCLEQVRKFHFLHWCLARSLGCTDSGGINMLLTNPLIISHVILL